MGIMYLTCIVDWLLFAVIVAISVNALTRNIVKLQPFWLQVAIVIVLLLLTDIYWLPAAYEADAIISFGNSTMAELLGESITAVELLQPDLLDVPLLLIQGLFGVYAGRKLLNLTSS